MIKNKTRITPEDTVNSNKAIKLFATSFCLVGVYLLILGIICIFTEDDELTTNLIYIFAGILAIFGGVVFKKLQVLRISKLYKYIEYEYTFNESSVDIISTMDGKTVKDKVNYSEFKRFKLDTRFYIINSKLGDYLISMDGFESHDAEKAFIEKFYRQNN